MSVDRIGFVGLGSMGAAIAERFVEANAQLTVYDIHPGNLEPFAAKGVAIAASPAGVADVSEIVFSCLPSTAASLAVALGENGVARGKAVKVYVDTATIGMKTAQMVADGLPADVGFVDAPVSGGPPGARAGTLSTMASGRRDHFDRVLPWLSIMAKSVFYMGEKPGVAQMAKLINNHLSAAGRIAAFEGFVLALKAGLDPQALLEVINVSSGRNYTTTDKIGPAILSGTFKFNGHLGNSIKDQTLLQEEADGLGVPLFIAPKLLETLKAAAADGYLEKDSMYLIQYMGEQAGIDVHALMNAGK